MRLTDQQLSDPQYSYVSEGDKHFMVAFDQEMLRLGYDFGGTIGSGYCWGRHMLIYAKTGVKSKQVAARIYMRESGIVLRLFLNQIDRHAASIEQAKPFIREVFTGERANCNHCREDGDGSCKFRKTYTIGGKTYEKCNGLTFEFHEPDCSKLPDYMALLNEFFPIGKRKNSQP